MWLLSRAVPLLAARRKTQHTHVCICLPRACESVAFGETRPTSFYPNPAPIPMSLCTHLSSPSFLGLALQLCNLT